MNIIEKPIEDLEGSSEPLTKPKKPRSEKQILAFQEALKKRQLNIVARKQDKEVKAAELLINKAKKEVVAQTVQVPPIEMPIPTPKPRAKSIVQESESDEEIIIVKSKPKKKVKKIIIESSSDSDSDSGSDGGTPQQQQYVQRHLYEPPTFNSNNYFI